MSHKIVSSINLPYRRSLIAALALPLLLTACGGGGGGTTATSGATQSTTSGTTASGTTVTGTAATGTPISQATVFAYDSSYPASNIACASATTGSDGTFQMDVSHCNSQGAVLAVSTGLSTLTSVWQGPGQNVVNITPITDTIVRSTLGGGINNNASISSLAGQLTPAQFIVLNAGKISLLEIMSTLYPVSGFNVNWSTTDPITTPFTANGSGEDGVLDNFQTTCIAGQSGAANNCGIQNTATHQISYDSSNGFQTPQALTPGQSFALPANISSSVGTIINIESSPLNAHLASGDTVVYYRGVTPNAFSAPLSFTTLNDFITNSNNNQQVTLSTITSTGATSVISAGDTAPLADPAGFWAFQINLELGGVNAFDTYLPNVLMLCPSSGQTSYVLMAETNVITSSTASNTASGALLDTPINITFANNYVTCQHANESATFAGDGSAVFVLSDGNTVTLTAQQTLQAFNWQYVPFDGQYATFMLYTTIDAFGSIRNYLIQWLAPSPTAATNQIEIWAE